MSKADNLAICRAQRCLVCTELGEAQSYPTEVDHITTRGAGGSDEQDNIWPLCVAHHRERHSSGILTVIRKYQSLRMYLEIMGRDDLLSKIL